MGLGIIQSRKSVTLCLNHHIKPDYSLISKPLNFIFIVIDLGALGMRILNEFIGARPSIFVLKIETSPDYLWVVGYVRTS